MSYEKTALCVEGKTKEVWWTDSEGVMILENLPNITANDDPNDTRQFDAKAIAATTTTCHVFELLRAAGVPVAYIEQMSSTSFASRYCDMLPFEAVGRRYAVGGYLKRHPEMTETNPPYRFPQLVTELFLKTTGGHCMLSDGENHDLGLDPALGQEDPLLHKGDVDWLLYHSKKPPWSPDANLGTLDFSLLLYDDIVEVDKLLRKTFMVLEGAWATLGWRLVDAKIEVGETADGSIVVADVIDNDSWRLRDGKWQEMSKQVFRDQLASGLVDLDDISQLYQEVADLTAQFRVPEQCILLWLSSKSDNGAVSKALEKTVSMPAGVALELITLSGHRQTQSVLDAIPIVEKEYPDGGVIIDCVGLSNGLGPIISTHTHWPVINLPLTPDEDWMSSMRLPGKVPATTALRLENAIHHGLQVLAQKNPAAYALVRNLAEADMGLPPGILFGDFTKDMTKGTL